MSDASKAIMVGGGGGESNPGVACTGTLTVTQSSITNAEVRTGGYQTTAKLVLDNTTVANATIIGQYPRSEPIEVTNSTVTNSIINSDAYNLGITLTGTAVSSSQLKIGCCGANLTLVGGTVSGSSITEGFGSPVNGPLRISGTTLTNTPVTLPSATATITGATFTYTSGATSPKLQFMSGTVTNTTITGNGSGIGMEFASGYGDVTVGGTTITDFATGLRFSGVRSSGTITVEPGNVFARNSSYNLDNRTAMSVAAANNYWGTTDIVQINLKTFDHGDDFSTGSVAIGSYLSGIPAAPTFTSQPVNRIVNPGQTAVFSLSAGGIPSPSYQWQIRVAGSGTWSGLVNNGVYSGANATSLTVSNITMGMNGDQFRCVASNLFGSINSDPRTLTVTTENILPNDVIISIAVE